MCTPVGHSLAAYSVVYTNQRLWIRHYGFLFLVVVVVGNLPDFDLIFGYFVGNPNQYHHLWTHSIVFCIMMGLLTGFGYWLINKKNGSQIGWVIFLIILSHIILDYFTIDTNEVKGLQLFWPLSKRFFISPVPIFQEVYKSSANSTFIQSLFCWHNLRTIVIETVILGPIQILLWIRFRIKKNRMVVST